MRLRVFMRWFALLPALLLAASSGLAITPAAAQLVPGQGDATEAESQAPDAKITALMALLSDAEVRQWLEQQLAEEPPQPPAESADSMNIHLVLEAGLARVRQRIQDLETGIEELPEEAVHADQVWMLEMSEGRMLASMLSVLVFAVTGFIAEWLFWRVAGPVRQRLIEAPRGGMELTLGRTMVRAVIELLAIGFFALGSLGAFLMFDWSPIVRLLVLSFLLIFTGVRLLAVLSRFVLAPGTPALRLVPASTETAIRVHRWIVALATVGVIGFVMWAALRRLGFFEDSLIVLVHAVGLVIALMLVGLVWRTRRETAAAMVGDDTESVAGRLRSYVADLWPLVATLVILFTWLSWSLAAYKLMWMVIILFGLPLVLWLSKVLVEAACTQQAAAPEAQPVPPADDGQHLSMSLAATDLHAPASAGAGSGETHQYVYMPVILRFVRVAVILAALIALASVWGVDLIALTGDYMTKRRDPGPGAAAVDDAAAIQAVARDSWHAAYDDVLGPERVDDTVSSWYDPERLVTDDVEQADRPFYVAIDETDDGDGTDEEDGDVVEAVQHAKRYVTDALRAEVQPAVPAAG